MLREGVKSCIADVVLRDRWRIFRIVPNGGGGGTFSVHKFMLRILDLCTGLLEHEIEKNATWLSENEGGGCQRPFGQGNCFFASKKTHQNRLFWWTRFCVTWFWKALESDFFGKTLRTWKFSTRKFFGARTHGILPHSGFRKHSWFGWPSLLFEVIAAQREGGYTKLDEFSEKFQTAFDPSPSFSENYVAIFFRKIMLQIFYNGYGRI